MEMSVRRACVAHRRYHSTGFRQDKVTHCRSRYGQVGGPDGLTEGKLLSVTDRRARLLLVTLEAARLDVNVSVLHALRSWLNSWRGIGDVERGMARQGYVFSYAIRRA